MLLIRHPVGSVVVVFEAMEIVSAQDSNASFPIPFAPM